MNKLEIAKEFVRSLKGVEKMILYGSVAVKVISPSEFERLRNTHFFSQIEKEGVIIG
jgi:hypothetical protein